jgi:hypothetical protein
MSKVLVNDGPSLATLAHATDRRCPVVFRVDEGSIRDAARMMVEVDAGRNSCGAKTIAWSE